ncbi:MAG: hypothetical protein LBI10_05855 [Deltaproteobacteria bacterium]|jgi:hypothetical protein|nr:hypothetical protein [Deltaproteobacteria bacterium]
MRIYLGIVGLGILTFLALTFTANAQEGQSFQFEELDYNSQDGGRSAQSNGPIRDASDELLRRMFSDDDTPPPATTPPASNRPSEMGTLQNLPGVPSPTQTPARPGEALIERSGSGGGRSGARNYSKAEDYEPFQRRWFEAEKAWSREKANVVVPCVSLIPTRVLYHVSCVGNLKNR